MEKLIRSACRIGVAASFALALVACGGGGGSHMPTSTTGSSKAVVSSVGAEAAPSSKSSASRVASSVRNSSSVNVESSVASVKSSIGASPSSVTSSQILVGSSKSSVTLSLASNDSSMATSTASIKSSTASISSNVSSMTSVKSSSASSRSVSSTSQSSVALVITNLSVSVDHSELFVGDVAAATVVATYSNMTAEVGLNVLWHSSDDSIASIDSTGAITAKRAGHVLITAEKSQLTSNAIDLVVKEVPVNLLNIHIVSSDATGFLLGATRQLSVTGDYSNANGVAIPVANVSFISSNPAAVSVANGLLNAIALGKSTITATYLGKSATYDVEVLSVGISFHFLKPASWAGTVKAHYWLPKNLVVPAIVPSVFPGSTMQDVDADGWYDITFNDATEINVLFNDGGSSSAGFHQTADQFVRRGGWFVPDSFPNKATGKYFGTWYDTKPNLVKQPECDVINYGAKGDGVTSNTVAIQKAIDDCSAKNGIVRLHDGKFLSGSIVLKSNVTLRVEPTATLLGSRNKADYPDRPKLTGNSQYLNCRKSLIYAEKATNIRIDGGGTIDGNGGSGSPWGGLEATRPMAIFIVQGDGVTIQNVTVQNSAMWTIVPFESSNVLIRGVTVNSLVGSNLDGIDIVDGHNVLIESVDITSQDDSICLKSGSSRGVIDVLVRNSLVRQSTVANGLKFGTATTGPFTNIIFDTITLNNVARGGIAVESVDGSAVSNITYRNITMKQVGTPFYIVLGDRGATGPTTLDVGSIDHITFENIVATDTTKTWGSYMSGYAEPNKNFKLTNLLFKNVNVTFKGGSTNFGPQPEYNATYRNEYPDPGDARNKDGNLVKKDMPAYFFFRHVDGLTLTNVTVGVVPADKRPLIIKEDVINAVTN